MRVVNDLPALTFVPASYTVETGEAERIAVVCALLPFCTHEYSLFFTARTTWLAWWRWMPIAAPLSVRVRTSPGLSVSYASSQSALT